MRLRRLLAGLALAGLVAAPSAAFADQEYTPFDSGDLRAGDAGNPSNPQIDLIRVQASRTDTTFTVVSTFTGVPNATRSRYYVGLAEEGDTYDLFELVVKRNGTTKANHYLGHEQPGRTLPQRTTELRRGVSGLVNVPCQGYSVRTDKAARTLTFTIPATCVTANNGYAYLYSTAARWTNASWDGSRPSNDDAKPSSKSDGAGNFWPYTPPCSPGDLRSTRRC